MKFNDFLNSLTKSQAQVWSEASERFMHVVDSFDEVLNADGSANERRVEAVEARFEALLSS